MKIWVIFLLAILVSGCSPSWRSSSSVSNSSNSQKQELISASTATPTPTVEPTNASSVIVAPALQAAKDEVFIIIYRESGFAGSATAWPIKYNGAEIGKLKNGSFIAIKTNAGKKHFLPTNNTGILSGKVEDYSFNAQAGKTYYLRHGTPSIVINILQLIPTDASVAKNKVANYSMVRVLDEYVKPKTGARGEIAFLKGRAVIERGIKTLPAKVGSLLYAGDKVNVEEASQASIEIYGSGIIKITETTSFLIPEPNSNKSAPPSMADSMWGKMKDLLKGNNNDGAERTATAGVRG